MPEGIVWDVVLPDEVMAAMLHRPGRFAERGRGLKFVQLSASHAFDGREFALRRAAPRFAALVDGRPNVAHGLVLERIVEAAIAPVEEFKHDIAVAVMADEADGFGPCTEAGSRNDLPMAVEEGAEFGFGALPDAEGGENGVGHESTRRE